MCLLALLTFCLVLTGIFFNAPIEAEAAVGDEFTVGGIEYRVLTETEENYTVEVSDAYYAGSNVVIPETVSYNSTTYTVKAIGDSSFYNTSITSVRIPNTVTEIKNYAFQATRGLTELIIPDSVTKIGESAFYKASGLRSITLSQNITEIARDTFNQCTNLESVIIPANVKTVKQGAFFGCSSLETISVLSTNVTLETGSIPTTVATVYGYEGSTAQTYCTNTGISFSALTVTSIEIPSEFLEQIYLIDGELVPFDITATYNNNMTETVPVKADMVTGFDTDTARENATATVAYGEKTAEFIYTVVLCMDHDYDNGFCTVCDEYQPADITTDKHDINGDGEPDEVYEIGNAGQLYWFADKVNNDWDNFKNANAVLTDDIVVNENVVVDGRLNSDEATVAKFRHWSAVGYLETNGYYGVFDGQGYTVSGLYHNDDSLQTGLFASLYGTARNVGVVNSYLYGDCEVAAISGNARENAEILNCFSINNVLRICDGGGDAGGIVGYTYGDGAVRNCYAAENYFFDSSWESLSGYDISTKNEYSVVFVFENCYYLAESETDIHEGTAFKTAAQFASGEVAYLLGEGWGQTLSGADADEYPVLGGAKVNYGYTTCDPDQIEKIYTNSNVSEEKPGHTGGTATCEALAICDECGVEYGNYAGHIPNNDDGDCTTDITCSVCGDVTTEGNAEHTGGTAASCTTDQVCTECGEVLVEALGHNYNEQVDNTVRTTAADCQECNTYWYDCSRCGQSAKNDATATDKWYTSNEAGEHNMSSDWTSENGQHFHKCTVTGCDHVEDTEDCDGGRATCQAKAICATCGASYGELAEHNFTEKIEDEAHLKEAAVNCISFAVYWFDCADCDEISNSLYFTSEVVGAHSLDGDGFCTLCDSGFEEPNYNANRDMNGDGTPDGAYEITKAGHLYWLATQEDYIDRHVILLNDIVINENVLLQNGSLNEAATDGFRHWTPIYGIGEGVIFDGNGRSIGGVYFNEYDCESGGCIFAKNYGLVKNLTVKDSYFESWLSGGIAGYNYVTLDNCHSVNNTFVSTQGVGGIVCVNEITAIIKNCTNSSRIFVISDADGVIYACSGGIVAVNMGTVQDCVNTGDINVETICVSSAELFVGGVVGLNELNDSYEIIVADCRNEGDISVCAERKTEGGAYYEAYVGGVVGGAYGGEYDDLTNTGDIEIDISEENCVGGIVGRLAYGAMLTDSHNEGGIKLLSWSAVGGVAGNAYEGARILGCYNTGDITVRSLQDFLAIGGIVCYCDVSVVVNCYNAGDITVEIDESLASDELEYVVSGIADVSESFFANCYNSGSITVEEHQGLILTYGVYVSESDTVTIVENCYYLYSTSTENGGRTAEQFANGEVAYLIAKDFTYGEGEFAIHVDGDIWGQLIGTDPVPTMNNVNKVYALSHCAGNATLYTNNPNRVYTLLKTDAVTATCLVPGNTDYWTCLVCGKLYSDEACTLETTLQTVNLGYAEHTFGTTWDYKATDGHAHVCTVTGCGAHDTVQAHNPNIPAATEESAQYCTACQYQMVAQLNHTHSPAAEWTSNATHHWKACGGCDEHLEEAPHSYDPNNACDTTCEVCNAVREVAHSFTGEWQKDASGHWHVCTKNGCSVTDTKQNHVSAGAATETDPEVCSICGWQIAPALGHITHTPESEWQKNETHHWHECTGCDGQELDKAAHNDGNNDGSCDACGYVMSVTPPSHTHAHGSTWVTDANEHWNECECGDKANKAAHVDDNGDNKCDTCDYTMPANDPDTPPVDNPPTDDNDGLGTGAIIGIVVAAVAVVGGGGFAIFWFVIRKKRR